MKFFYLCKRCPFVFAKWKPAAIHGATVHPEHASPLPYECVLCETSFAVKGQYVQHTVEPAHLEMMGRLTGDSSDNPLNEHASSPLHDLFNKAESYDEETRILISTEHPPPTPRNPDLPPPSILKTSKSPTTPRTLRLPPKTSKR